MNTMIIKCVLIIIDSVYVPRIENELDPPACAPSPDPNSLVKM